MPLNGGPDAFPLRRSQGRPHPLRCGPHRLSHAPRGPRRRPNRSAHRHSPAGRSSTRPRPAAWRRCCQHPSPTARWRQRQCSRPSLPGHRGSPSLPDRKRDRRGQPSPTGAPCALTLSHLPTAAREASGRAILIACARLRATREPGRGLRIPCLPCLPFFVAIPMARPHAYDLCSSWRNQTAWCDLLIRYNDSHALRLPYPPRSLYR